MSNNEAQRNAAIFLIATAALLLIIAGSKGQDDLRVRSTSDRTQAIPVTNSTGSTITLWIWDDVSGRWREPPLRVHRGGKASFSVRMQQSYYMVVRDDKGRDFPLSRTNFGDLLKRLPGGVLDLSAYAKCHSIVETHSYRCRRCGKVHYYKTYPQHDEDDTSIVARWSDPSDINSYGIEP